MSLRVLLLEDEAYIRRICVRALAPFHWQITQAETMSEVLSMDSLGTFDLLITDIMLADGNGLDAAVQFLNLNPSAPIVVITGSPTAGVEERARRIGVKWFIRKPFRIEEFVLAAREAASQLEKRAP